MSMPDETGNLVSWPQLGDNKARECVFLSHRSKISRDKVGNLVYSPPHKSVTGSLGRYLPPPLEVSAKAE